MKVFSPISWYVNELAAKFELLDLAKEDPKQICMFYLQISHQVIWENLTEQHEIALRKLLLSDERNIRHSACKVLALYCQNNNMS